MGKEGEDRKGKERKGKERKNTYEGRRKKERKGFGGVEVWRWNVEGDEVDEVVGMGGFIGGV